MRIINSVIGGLICTFVLCFLSGKGLACSEVVNIEALISHVVDTPWLEIKLADRQSKVFKLQFKDELIYRKGMIVKSTDDTSNLPKVILEKLKTLETHHVWIVQSDLVPKRNLSMTMFFALAEVAAPIRSNHLVSAILLLDNRFQSEVASRHELQHIEDIIINPTDVIKEFPKIPLSVAKKIMPTNKSDDFNRYQNIFSLLYLNILESRASYRSIQLLFSRDGHRLILDQKNWARELMIIAFEFSNLSLAYLQRGLSAFCINPLDHFWIKSLAYAPIYFIAGLVAPWIVITAAYPVNLVSMIKKPLKNDK